MTTPTTAFARVADAARAALLQVPSLASGNVSANRTREWPAEVHEAINLRLGDASVDSSTNCGVMYRVEIAIEMVARAVGVAELSDPALSVDALLSAVDDRLRDADFSAVGCTEILDSELSWDFAAAEQPVAKVTATYPFMIHATRGFLVSA